MYTSEPSEGRYTPGAYNRITTPNGGQYALILSDGSHVWLNAGSSLKYPVKFTGTARVVELTGEAYFEVKKHPTKQFIVKTSEQRIAVLGTSFNVQAYSGEAAVTTLAEGSVELSGRMPNTRLMPGDQATLSADGIFKISKVNASDFSAWKDGLFVFSGTGLKDVLLQIARWYDVEVDYNSIPDIAFEGEIPRSVPLSEVLTLIERAGHIQLKLTGGKIH